MLDDYSNRQHVGLRGPNLSVFIWLESWLTSATLTFCGWPNRSTTMLAFLF